MQSHESPENHVVESTNMTKKTTPTTAPAVDAIELLITQHREVDALFEELASAGDIKRNRERIVHLLVEKLKVHTDLEERIFYPVAKRADAELVLESLEEHANVKSMLRKLTNTDASDKTFKAKIAVLKDMVMAHIAEEEEILFSKARVALGPEMLLHLGSKMQQRVSNKKSTVPTRRQKASQKRRAAARVGRNAAGKRKRSRLH